MSLQAAIKVKDEKIKNLTSQLSSLKKRSAEGEDNGQYRELLVHAQKQNEEDAEKIQTLEKQLSAKRQKIQTLEADLALSAARQDAAVHDAARK